MAPGPGSRLDAIVRELQSRDGLAFDAGSGPVLRVEGLGAERSRELETRIRRAREACGCEAGAAVTLLLVLLGALLLPSRLIGLPAADQAQLVGLWAAGVFVGGLAAKLTALALLRRRGAEAAREALKMLDGAGGLRR